LLLGTSNDQVADVSIGSIFLWKYLPATCLACNKLRCESLFFCHNGLNSIKFLLHAVHFANHCVRSPVANQCLEIPGSSASNVVAVTKPFAVESANALVKRHLIENVFLPL
jgi:hypothetical protein